MEKIHLPIIIEIDEDRFYIVSCPVFKGCHSYGETIDEALENIREVIDMCLEDAKIEEINKFVGLEKWKLLNMPKLPVFKGKEFIKFL